MFIFFFPIILDLISEISLVIGQEKSTHKTDTLQTKNRHNGTHTMEQQLTLPV